MRHRSRILPALLATCALAAPALAQHASAPRTGEALIRRMHGRYAGQWYRTLSFTQATSRVMADSVHVETWREFATIPGALRIDMGDPAAHNGALFKGDSLFVIQGGRVARRIARRNPLMVLGFDVYGQSPERSLQVLREEGFNTAPIREDTFEGRPVYVVGAAAGDLHTRQFWVDRERLLFVRLLEPAQADSTRTSDIRFLAYKRYAGGWVSERVEMYNDGKRVMWEDYTDVKVNEALPPALFDPDHWATAPAAH
jgi:hypothetical protein